MYNKDRVPFMCESKTSGTIYGVHSNFKLDKKTPRDYLAFKIIIHLSQLTKKRNNIFNFTKLNSRTCSKFFAFNLR